MIKISILNTIYSDKSQSWNLFLNSHIIIMSKIKALETIVKLDMIKSYTHEENGVMFNHYSIIDL